MFVTRDPDKAAIKLTTDDPSKGFGPGVLFESEDEKLRDEAVDTNMPQALVTKKKGGMVRSSASRRADGCAIRGKTKGRMV
jgi:hypothetical protein